MLKVPEPVVSKAALDVTYVAYLPSVPSPDSVVAFIESASPQMSSPLNKFEFWGDVSRPRRGRWSPERALTLLRDGDRGEPARVLSVIHYIRGGNNNFPTSHIMVSDQSWNSACSPPATIVSATTRIDKEPEPLPIAQAWARASVAHLGQCYGLGYATASSNLDFDYSNWWVNGTVYNDNLDLGECAPLIAAFDRVRDGECDLTPMYDGQICRSVRAVNVLSPELARRVRLALEASGSKLSDSVEQLDEDHVMWTVFDESDQRSAQKTLYEAGLCIEESWVPLSRHVVQTPIRQWPSLEPSV